MVLPRYISRLLNRWPPKNLRHFIRAKDGATMIEFGILAPPFFLVLIAILETVMASLAGQILQTAIHDTSRLILTGQVQKNGLTQENYRQLVGLEAGKAQICLQWITKKFQSQID